MYNTYRATNVLVLLVVSSFICGDEMCIADQSGYVSLLAESTFRSFAEGEQVAEGLRYDRNARKMDWFRVRILDAYDMPQAGSPQFAGEAGPCFWAAFTLVPVGRNGVSISYRNVAVNERLWTGAGYRKVLRLNRSENDGQPWVVFDKRAEVPATLPALEGALLSQNATMNLGPSWFRLSTDGLRPETTSTIEIWEDLSLDHPVFDPKIPPDRKLTLKRGSEFTLTTKKALVTFHVAGAHAPNISEGFRGGLDVVPVDMQIKAFVEEK